MADPRKIEDAIRRVRNQGSFIQDLLIDALGWDIAEKAEDIEEISFEWSAEELRADGLDEHIVDGTIRQIRPFSGNPWGIFILEFKNPDVFTTARGMTGTLRKVLRGLVPSKRRRSNLASFGRENLLFICNHDYKHFRFAHFKAPGKDSQTAPLAAFGWGPGDPIRTLCEYNLNALEWPDGHPDAEGWIAAWSQAFDVDKVTKRFYQDYAAVFENVEKVIGRENEFKGDDLRMFTQTLFNRLMFLRFMERKGWLTFSGHKDYLRAIYAAGDYGKKSFYNGRLCALFFEGLAVEGKQESDAYGCVPYLNGGLFERSELDKKVADLPDEMFAGILGDERAGGLFYRYNFTVEESTPLDIEVAVDPEMLGKVFEELVTGRHETGSYYTPRPVVSFMCREALKGYLSDKLLPSPSGRGAGGEGKSARHDKIIEAVAALVDRHDVGKLKESHAREILAALDDLKAVDPACGSGAYLLGLLQEMISLYRSLYSEKLVKDTRSLYEMKLRIISQNLYGVDIDPFATNIAMLRLWLSLTVEADEPVPLPNLDFKIETGDSLLAPDPQVMPDLFRGLLQASADGLAMVKHQFFLSHGEEKESYRKTIVSAESRLRKELAAEYGEGVVDWRIQFAEAFADRRGGFDIVLANPPYVRQELITHLKPTLRKVFPDVYAGAADLYVYFYARAVQLLRPSGVLSFIAPNKFFRSGYGEKLREYLANNTCPRVLIDFADYPIFQAITYPSIIVTQKCATPRRKDGETVLAYNWQQSDDITHIGPTFLAQGSPLPQSSLEPDGWRIHNATTRAVIEKLRKSGPTLDSVISHRLYRGIVTGCNDVFEIDQDTYESLVRDDRRSAEIIRPWLRGRHIRRWGVDWGGRYLIFTRRGIQIDCYPAIKKYLAHHRDRLEPRPSNAAPKEWPGRKPGSYKWYEIQDAIDYWQEFDKPKIIFQEIATYQQFASTSEPYLSNNKTWIIPDPPLGLVGILNSKVAWFFLDKIAAKLQGGAFALQSIYLDQIPIVTPTRDLTTKVEAVQRAAAEGGGDSQAAMTLEADIDEIVVRMYGLSRGDEDVIDQALAVFANRFPWGFRDSDECKEYARAMFGED